ncbi:MAG: ketopantoate reductase family protein [Deltaproteobacteria bacterium]|jgi:2-dehydropantoate 2-reductase|nr:ketopantoate reductase family protein [Deltaproteobacteria bacterium]
MPRLIYVLGAGAMGGLYAAYLSRDKANLVTLITSRPQMAEVVKARGLIVQTPKGPFKATNLRATTEPEAERGPASLLVVLVKAPDTALSLSRARPLVGPETMVLSLQNGLGNLEVIGDIVGSDRVIGGVSSFGAQSGPIGEVILRGYGQTIIGEPSGSISPRLTLLAEILNQASLSAILTDDLLSAIWTKLIVNAGINALAAILRAPNGAIVEHPEAASIMEAAVKEGTEVAAKIGLKLAATDMVDYVANICRLTSENYCSMLQDVLRHRPTEINVINGALVKEGLKQGIPTEVNRILANMVAVIERTYPAS